MPSEEIVYLLEKLKMSFPNNVYLGEKNRGANLAGTLDLYVKSGQISPTTIEVC